MNKIENENKIVTGEVFTPNEREHLFTNIDALTDFVKVFKLKNFNVRYGKIKREGKEVFGFQLVYQVEDN